MISLGVDVGSRAIKVAILDPERRTAPYFAACDQEPDPVAATGRLLEQALRDCRRAWADVGRVWATGYGRRQVTRAHQCVSEITAHARGVAHVCPGTRTVLDVGGQDCKAILLAPDSGVADFQMNDRCAAGTGRFFEVIAPRLGVPVDGLGRLAAARTAPCAISSMCAVFAETEVVGLLAAGRPPADIAAGILEAAAQRIALLAGPRPLAPVVVTGGGALVPGLPEALAAALKMPVHAAPGARFTGALGAALLAAGDGAT